MIALGHTQENDLQAETQQMEDMVQPIMHQGVTSYPGMISRLTPQMPWGQTGEEMQTVSAVDASPMPTAEGAFHNSWKGMLSRNIGREMLVTFLVGSQDTVVAQGTLHEVGNDYISLYHPNRDSYISADIYSIRFVEINPTENGEGPN